MMEKTFEGLIETAEEKGKRLILTIKGQKYSVFDENLKKQVLTFCDECVATNEEPYVAGSHTEKVDGDITYRNIQSLWPARPGAPTPAPASAAPVQSTTPSLDAGDRARTESWRSANDLLRNAIALDVIRVEKIEELYEVTSKLAQDIEREMRR